MRRRLFQQLPRIRAIAATFAAGLTAWGALPDFEFSPSANAGAWEAAGGAGALQSTTNGLEITIVGEDPRVTSPPMSFDGDRPLLLKVRLRSEAAGEFQIFHFRDHAREEESIRFPIPAFRWVDATVPLPVRGDGWRLRMDPPGTNGTCVLERLWVEEVGAVGITRITAEGTDLVFHVEGVTGPVELVSLPPGEDFSSAIRGFRLFAGDLTGPADLRIARRAFEGRERVDRLYRGFLLRRPLSGPQPRTFGAVRHVESFSGVARHGDTLTTPATRKGLQVQMVDDAVALGIGHAALNVDLPSLVDLGKAADSYTWELDGTTYHFRRSAVDAIPVKPLSDAGAAVHLILLAYEPAHPELRRIFLHPGYDRRAPNRLGAFNTANEEGIDWLRAALEFLADRFSRPDQAHGRVSGYIVGNEVTAHWHWANMGEVSADAFIDAYLSAVRLVHTAVRTASADARVYLSLDHHWNLVYGNAPLRAIAGRTLIDRFQQKARMGGDFDWHLAYHPYPENLFEPRTWLDKTAEHRPESPRITFRNLGVLTDYLARPELRHGDQPRRVILSEQGFHSDGTPGGEAAQAAGYCYAWKKVNALPGIDAFILHRHVDHGQEGGLNLGLWRRKEGSVATPDTRKPIYEVFRAAGTDAEAEAFRFALPLIGIRDWSELRP